MYHELGAEEMAQPWKLFALQTQEPEFALQNSHLKSQAW